MLDPEFTTGLSPAETERLALLMEECAEVQQIIGKILRHGYASKHPNGGPTNRALLEKELGHVDFALSLMLCNDDVLCSALSASAEDKRMSVARYLHYQTKVPQ